jgi:ribonuclease R
MPSDAKMRQEITRLLRANDGAGLRRTTLRELLGRMDEKQFRKVIKAMLADETLRGARGGLLVLAAKPEEPRTRREASPSAASEASAGRRGRAGQRGRQAASSPSSQVGVIQMNSKGFGFVSQLGGTHKDIFIPVGSNQGAFSGDRVRVRVTAEDDSRGPVGEVLEILERGQEEIVGCFGQRDDVYGLRPLRRELPSFIPLVAGDGEAALAKGVRAGDWVLVELQYQSGDRAQAQAKLLRRLQKSGTVSGDLQAVMREYELSKPYTVSYERLAEAQEPLPVPREDCRALTLITVDPLDARDFDDALSLTPTGEPGVVTVGVHIADVACFIPVNEKLDLAARSRGFTAYLPGKTLPMLPNALATDRCSLRENEERLAHSVFMDIDTRSGELRSYRRVHTLVRVRQRLAYEEVERVLSGTKHDVRLRPGVEELLRLLTKCAETMRQRRQAEELFLPLAVPELRVICTGKPLRVVGIQKREGSPSEEMIEEFMLAANVCIARELVQRKLAGVYRNHASPAAEILDGFAAQAGVMLQRKAPALRKRPALIKFLRNLGEGPTASMLGFSLLRIMPRAEYNVENQGHFGLGKELYCHFTSPIRRYTDLLLHQQLLALDQGRPPRTEAQLGDEVARCNAQEANVDQAGFALADRLKLRYLLEQQKGRRAQPIIGLVSRVMAAGLNVYLPELGLLGFVPLRRLGPGPWQFVADRYALENRRSKKRHRCGDEISLRITEADVVRGELEMAPFGS